MIHLEKRIFHSSMRFYFLDHCPFITTEKYEVMHGAEVVIPSASATAHRAFISGNRTIVL
jgi:hypothetical protein